MSKVIRLLSLCLVLLMIVPLAVACNDKNNNDDPEQTEAETERITEAETEPELTPEEIEQIKSEMSNAILDALGKVETTTEQQTQPPQQEEETTGYDSVVDNLLGSLGGLGNGDYDYTKMIAEVLDLYIGTDSRSEFVIGLIKLWLDNKSESSEQTSVPEEETTEKLPERDDEQSLQEFIADKTAEAVADAIVERINEAIDETVHKAIYDAVYNAMKSDDGYMDGILEEMIPGYGQLSGLLGGFGQ